MTDQPPRGSRTPAPGGPVVAIVPAKDRADSVGQTVAALLGLDRVDRVLVVDDGSTDGTTAAARAAGADVLRLPVNRGKGGAVAAGVAAAPDAGTYLLIDADLAGTAAVAGALLDPVLSGDADLAVGVLPSAGGRGGFGKVRDLARGGIRRATGREVVAPLSGQRAVHGELLRSLPDSDRFGLEVAMSIDALRAGARLVEVEVPMDHRHTGRTVAGFAHRGRQGLDILRALWPRLTTVRVRIALVLLAGAVLVAGLGLSGARAVPTSEPRVGTAERVVVLGIPRLGLDDVGTGRLPAIDRLAAGEGAMAATTVRTLGSPPAAAEAYATLGAGSRVRARGDAHLALPADREVEGTTAAELLARRTGVAPRGEIVVPVAPTIFAGAGQHLPSEPGALGQALQQAGLRTAVVNNADGVADDGSWIARRPAVVAMMDRAGSVDTGAIEPEHLVVPDAAEPFGVRADVDRYVAETAQALESAAVVLVDLGDTHRAASYAPVTTRAVAEAARVSALQRADEYLGALLADVDDQTMVLVVGVTPPTSRWELTPTLAYGAGVTPGTLHSLSTRTEGLVTLTDLAPTIIDALALEVPGDMIGQPLRYRPVALDLDEARRANDLATSREGIYFSMSQTFIVVQALFYLLVAVVVSQGARGRVAPYLRWGALTCAAWPLATFVERGIPGIERAGDARQVLVWVLAGAVALLAARARRHALAPLGWIAGSTVALLVVDVATGATLQSASILGYSPHTAARFTGFGNTAFAVLAACAAVSAAIIVQRARRRREAVVLVGVLFAVVVFANAWPTLGANTGAMLTTVPVFGLMLVAFLGLAISWRTVIGFAVAAVVAFGLLGAVNVLLPGDQGAHLGGFISDALEGDGGVLTTISRKWATNMRVFGQTVWTWMVPITVAFVMYVLVVARGWQRMLPTGSPQRIGVVGTLMAGVVGWLVNDSGVIVAALVFVYIGPLLALLALAPPDEPDLLGPGDGTPEGSEAATASRSGRPSPPVAG